MKVTCTCGAVLKSPAHAAGKKVRCPRCSASVQVPGFDSPSPLSESQTEHYEEDAPPPLVEPPSLSQNPGPPPTLQESSATAPSAEKHALGADSVVSASLLSTAIPQGKKLPPEDSGLVRSRHQPQSGGYASRDTSGGRGKPHLYGFWSRRLVLLAVVAVAGVAFFLGYGSRLLVTSPPETPAESNVTCGTGTMLNGNTCVCIREVRSVRAW